ncbi:hypothetical protein DIC66_15950 [Rhodoferax lacus]|uniref:Uncharacterized protein n=1 Tax=Rhodoferax lacus TaxID=2184758 RepID=A0A3E1RB70_9BURK|nr:hypothetical protein [Rhodoferax lacus]RFO95920.1 hypothetical protein DIC66_15950 [Rhodoferax lacus]
MSKFDTGSLARFVWRVEFIPYVVFTVIGAAVIYVLGGVGLNAWRNGSLIPPPTKLQRYDCSAPLGNFSVYYLHGTDRVQIKTANGLLDGTVQQNRFDWQGFANDRSLLGFAPPSEIVFDNAKTLRVSGPDLKDVVCTSTAEAGSERRAIVQ